MGGCCSCNSSFKIKNVRVVHLNGYVEDFEQPISASQVIGHPPQHFVCTSTQLLSSPSKIVNGDEHLQPGQVYFMLPYSVLKADVSPVDLVTLAKRLTTIAKTRPCERSYNKSLKDGPFSRQTKPSGSPRRVEDMMMNGGRTLSRVQLWKPILDTIEEKSFSRRSESDLQKYC